MVEEAPVSCILASGPRRAGESTGASPARRLLRVPFKSCIVGLSLITMDTRKIESRICACDLVFECLQKSGRISCRWSGRGRSAVQYGFFYFFSAKICRVWVHSLSGHRNSATGSHSFPIQFNVHFLLYQYLCLEHAELFLLRGKGGKYCCKNTFPAHSTHGFCCLRVRTLGAPTQNIPPVSLGHKINSFSLCALPDRAPGAIGTDENDCKKEKKKS